MFRFVRGDERAAYEARRRRDWPGFEIRERSGRRFVRAAQRPLYLALDKIIPVPVDHVAHGYDIWAFPPHRALVERALAGGSWTASGVVRLIEPRGGHGIVIALPLRSADAAGGKPDGVAEVVVNVADLVEQNLLRASLLRHQGIELVLLGKADGGAAMLEVARYGSAIPDGQQWWAGLLGSHMVERKRRFDVYGEPWELHARAREPASLHAGSVALLAVSLAFSLALTSYVQASVSRRRRVEQLVDLRTADLRRASETMRLYFRAIESSANAVILVDARGEGYPIEYVNPTFERMRGYAAHDLVGKPLEDLIDGLPEQTAVYELQNSMRQEREGHALLRLRRKDGSELFAEVYVAPVLGERGKVEHFVITEYDVTTTKQYEAQLEHRARYDTLTGLPNRVLLGDRIERAIAYARQHGQSLWVVALDLDQFKYVNDSLGHPAGDRLLKQAGQRICTAVGPADTAARTGGDEFVLLLVDRAGADQAAATVGDVLHAVGQPFEDGASASTSAAARASPAFRPTATTPKPWSSTRRSRCTAPRRPGAIRCASTCPA